MEIVTKVETVMLADKNRRLQTLVAELLVKNEELRRQLLVLLERRDVGLAEN